MRVPRAWPILFAAMLPGGCAELSQGATTTAPSFPAGATSVAPGTLHLTLGSEGHPAVARLLQQSGTHRLWRTEGKFVVATDGPRVVATSGQKQVLAAMRLEGSDPLASAALLPGQGEAAAGSSRWLVDLATTDRDPAGMRFGIEVVCRLSAQSQEEDPDLLLLEEECAGPSPIGHFTNHFWVQRSARTVQASQQWIGPDLPMLMLQGSLPLMP